MFLNIGSISPLNCLILTVYFNYYFVLFDLYIFFDCSNCFDVQQGCVSVSKLFFESGRNYYTYCCIAVCYINICFAAPIVLCMTVM